MHCGQMLAQPVPAPGGYSLAPAPVDSSTKKKVGIAVLVTALAAAILLGGLFATGMLRLGSASKLDAGLQATGNAPTPALVATGDAPPPNLQATGSKRVMPDDVRRWLEHLERIEKRRVDMSYDQVAKAMEMLVALQAGGTLEMLQGLVNEAMTGEESNAPKSTTKTAQSAEKIRAGWRQLLDDFRSFPPPEECGPIRDEYDVALRETGGMIGDILAAIDDAEANRDGALSALMKMRGKSVSIDHAAVESDGLVQAICDKYETRKWFKIRADIGGGSFSRGGF
jgi:hypothetical protein